MTRYLFLQVLGNSDIKEIGSSQEKNSGSDVLKDLGAYDEQSLKAAVDMLQE